MYRSSTTQYLNDLDFNLSRSLKVKCDGDNGSCVAQQKCFGSLQLYSSRFQSHSRLNVIVPLVSASLKKYLRKCSSVYTVFTLCALLR